jgi:hypothetical protein
MRNFDYDKNNELTLENKTFLSDKNLGKPKEEKKF